MGEYDDIINLPHYEPKYHPRMSMWKRAAQFAPFAAVRGYEEAVKETERKNEASYEPNYDDSERTQQGQEPLCSRIQDSHRANFQR